MALQKYYIDTRHGVVFGNQNVEKVGEYVYTARQCQPEAVFHGHQVSVPQPPPPPPPPSFLFSGVCSDIQNWWVTSLVGISMIFKIGGVWRH